MTRRKKGKQYNDQKKEGDTIQKQNENNTINA
jgi:hypothetical protein